MKDQFYQQLVESLYDGVYYVDRDRVITFWNRAAERISGYSAEEVLGKSCSDNILRHVDELGTELCITGCPLAATMEDGIVQETEVFLHHKQGHRVPVCVRGAPIKDEAGNIVGAVEVFSNNTKNMHALETIRQLQNESLHDALTGLGNRRFADVSLDNMLHTAEQENVPFGLLFVDIDHFKQVNDTWGHGTGDKVLTMVAQTLANGLRALDVPCRWGGEEFVVLLPNVNRQALSNVAERLRMLIENSWLEEGNEIIRVTASFGGALYMPGDTAKSLVARADSLVYKSKDCGRNCVHLQE